MVGKIEIETEQFKSEEDLRVFLDGLTLTDIEYTLK